MPRSLRLYVYHRERQTNRFHTNSPCIRLCTFVFGLVTQGRYPHPAECKEKYEQFRRSNDYAINSQIFILTLYANYNNFGLPPNQFNRCESYPPFA